MATNTLLLHQHLAWWAGCCLWSSNSVTAAAIATAFAFGFFGSPLLLLLVQVWWVNVMAPARKWQTREEKQREEGKKNQCSVAVAVAICCCCCCCCCYCCCCGVCEPNQERKIESVAVFGRRLAAGVSVSEWVSEANEQTRDKGVEGGEADCRVQSADCTLTGQDRCGHTAGGGGRAVCSAGTAPRGRCGAAAAGDGSRVA